MPKKTIAGKRKLFLFILIPLIIIAAALIVLFTGVNTFLKPSIKNALEKIVVNGSDSLYTFSLEDYAVGPGGRTVVIRGLDIKVDSNRYAVLKAAGQLPPLILSLHVNKASVTGLHAWTLWKHKKIICRTVGVENASVIFTQQQKKKDDTAKSKPPKTLYELMQPDIQLINVEKLAVLNADIIFKTAQQQASNKEYWHFEKANITMDDILVDSLSHADTTRAWYAANVHSTLEKFYLKPADGLYTYSFKKTEYDFKERTATIDSFNILPAVSNAEFNRIKGYETDQVTIRLPKLRFEQLNATAFLVQNYIEASTVHVTKPNIKLYKDRNAGPNLINKVGKYPHQLLLKADALIKVDTIKIDDGSLTVTQRSKKTQMEGSFLFRNINGNIRNITNLPSRIANNNWCKANLSADFMGNNAMNAVFAFDLATTNGHFIVDASLKTMQAANLNKMLRALASAELKSFELDKLNYHVEGYDHYAIGTLQLLYHDLKLNVLKEDDDGGFEKRGLMSLLANILKLYNDNPQPGKEERKAEGIRDERLPEKNFFGLVCRTLLKCTQEIAVKGDNKSLPGVGGGNDKNKK